jgi:hypothetical protein
LSNTNDSKAAERKAKEVMRSAYRDPIVWATIGIFVATAVSVGVGIAQWRALHNTDTSIGKQLKVMQNQLTAFIDADRPWVGIETIDITPLEAEKPFHAVIKFKNFGRSPAIRFQAYFEYGLRKPDAPALEIPNAIPANAAISTLMPNGTVTKEITTGDAPSKEFLELIRAGERILWLVSRVEYFDQLKRPHFTTDRGRYVPIGNSVAVIDGEAN